MLRIGVWIYSRFFEGERLFGRVVGFVQFFLTHHLSHLLDVFLTLITISSLKLTFSKKKADTTTRICGQIITWEVKNQYVKIISDWVLWDAKWRVEFEIWSQNSKQ